MPGKNLLLLNLILQRSLASGRSQHLWICPNSSTQLCKTWMQAAQIRMHVYKTDILHISLLSPCEFWKCEIISLVHMTGIGKCG